jgi:molybdate transport system substrate-binding protein
MIKIRRCSLPIISVLMVLGLQEVRADTVNVAVAANFTDAAKEIARVFKDKSGHEAVLSFGASGQLYAQIKSGAPFQVFLSADEERPRKLVEEGQGVAGEKFTYAIGKLVLWTSQPGLVINEETLNNEDFSKIAIANPTTAPYGIAAVEVMQSLNVYARLQPKIVQGNTIAQAFQFVKTDNAEYGFIALSQVANQKEGSSWIVPGKYYREIRQDAVLLKLGEANNGAKEFMKFLRSSMAKSIIQKFGYGTSKSASGDE